MRDMRLRSYFTIMLFLAVVTALGVWVSCGGGSSNTTGTMPSGTGMVATSINDPPTCAAPNGPYSNVWVTVTKVTAHINGDASPSDSGWQTLVDLTNAPKQIDLLSLASTTCVLTQLGSTSGLPPGNYQQIRLYLLDNSPASGTAVPSPNNCGGSSGPFNCVVPEGGSPQPLMLSSESQTGIKIPPGQIAGGGINLMAGQSADINIDFDACRSIVQHGNGEFRLKPTLVAGAVSLNQNSISGTVTTSSVGAQPVAPIPGAIVLLEQPDPNNANIDRVVRAGVSGNDGSFIFCPLPAGNYDVVIAALVTSIGGLTTTYDATVTLKVPLGTSMGTIPLVAEPITVGTTTTISSPATINGQITTAGSSGATPADISLWPLQSVGGGSTLLVTVPVFQGSVADVATGVSSASSVCPAGTDCVNYTLIVPASNPQVGTFSASPATSYTAPAANPAIYWVNAQAFVPTSASTNPGGADCNPSSLPATFSSGTGGNNLSLNPGDTLTQNFTFTACQ